MQMNLQKFDFELKYHKSNESKLKNEISNLQLINQTITSELLQHQQKLQQQNFLVSFF